MKLQPREEPFQLSLGRRGEMIAWGYLVRAGFKILEKNYRCKIGEIDAVAQKNRRLFFIEVKTRNSPERGRPEEAVGLVKQKKLIHLAEWFRKEKKLEKMPVSFAVLAILWNQGEPQVRFIDNAFGVSDESGGLF